MRDSNQSPAAFVTGAGRGIGRAVCVELARMGFDVVANDLDDAALADTKDLVEALGARCELLAADISVVEDHGRLVARAWEAFGTVDCLVNNAGISVAKRGDMLETAPESFDRLIAVNLRGPFFLSQAIARLMLERPASAATRRCLITISSANAAAASPDRAEYCISKTGLSMMTKLYALRLAEAGIAAYEIRPGVIRTAMTAVAKERYDQRYARGDFTPVNRWGEPEEVGRAVALLAGGNLSFSTGDVLNVDGGFHIGRL